LALHGGLETWDRGAEKASLHSGPGWLEGVMRGVLRAAAAVLIGWTGGAAAAGLPLEGAGTAKCSQFVAAFDDTSSNTSELVFFSWAEGYASGFNEAHMQVGGTGKDMSGMSVDQQQEFLRDYCSDHPGDDFMSAVTNLYQTMRAAR
jgi:hypothetical protein